MSRRRLAGLLAVLSLAILSALHAPLAETLPRIGYLSGSSQTAMSSRTEAFRQGLRDLGYVEGTNVVIEYRYGDGTVARVPTLAADLRRLKVDLIVVAGGNALLSATRGATDSVPLVMANVLDPVGSGFIASLARPGGNITGLSALTSELTGKRLDLVREILPGVSRVAALFDPQDASKIVEVKGTELAARVLGIELQTLEVRSSSDFERAIRAAARERAGALLVLQSALTTTGRRAIADLATKNRLPTVWADGGLMDAGGLMSYGPNVADMFRRAAYYVDRLLKGAKPAELPVEQPVTFELVVNVETAKRIGITLPPSVLARADKVIR